MSAEAGAAKSRGLRVAWPTLVVVALFGVVYAYDLFEAASNLFGVTAQLEEFNAFATENGLAARSVPWAVLVTNLLLAPIGFIAAVVLGRHQNLPVRALVLAVGLCVIAAMSLSLAAFV